MNTKAMSEAADRAELVAAEQMKTPLASAYFALRCGVEPAVVLAEWGENVFDNMSRGWCRAWGIQ